jgi:hypothetical protein
MELRRMCKYNYAVYSLRIVHVAAYHTTYYQYILMIIQKYILTSQY